MSWPFLKLSGRDSGWRTRTALVAWALALALVVPCLFTLRIWWWEPRVEGHPAAYWVEGLCSEDYRVRDQAEKVLRASGGASVPGLVRILEYRESTWGVLWRRWAPSWALRGAGRPTATAMRCAAARTLGELGEAGAPAADALVQVLRKESVPVGDVEISEAQAALRKIGDPALAALGKGLRHPKANVRARVADLLCTPGNFSSVRARQELGPLLEAALWDPAGVVRERASSALGVLGEFKPGTLVRLGVLCGEAQDPPEARLAALRALGAAGVVAAGQVQAVAGALGAAQPEVRLEAARAAWKIVGATGNKPLLDQILQTLGELVRGGGYRWQASLAVGEMGEVGAPLIPDLVRAMRDEMPHRPSRTPPVAAVVLGRMGAPARPALLELIRDPEPSMRLSAGVALLGHGAGAAAAVPDLLRMLDEPENEARIVASQVLGSVGPAAAAALPRLNILAQSPDEYVRSAATGAIGRIRGGGVVER